MLLFIGSPQHHIPYTSPGPLMHWLGTLGYLEASVGSLLHVTHSLHTCSTSSFQLGQYVSVLARSFDLTTPICDSCNLARNWHLSPIGTMILFWKNMIPSTICSSYLCWKYGLMSSSASSLPLSGHPSCMTLVSLYQSGIIHTKSSNILPVYSHWFNTWDQLFARFNVSSSMSTLNVKQSA